MHHFGGFQAGRTFLIDRGSLLLKLQQIEERGEFGLERARKERLGAELERAQKLLPGRQVKIPVEAGMLSRRMIDLPEGIVVTTGHLHINFRTTEELLQRLFELSQAILNDYDKFEAICTVASMSSDV